MDWVQPLQLFSNGFNLGYDYDRQGIHGPTSICGAGADHDALSMSQVRTQMLPQQVLKGLMKRHIVRLVL